MAVQSSHLRQIKGKLVLWDTRLRVTQSLVWLPRGIVGGLAVALVLAIVSRFTPLFNQGTLIILGLALPVAGALAALLGVWLWRRSTLDIARRFDHLFGLRERLSTALELSQGALPVESQLIARRQLEQAAEVTGYVKPSHQMPLRIDWRWWAGIGIAASLLIVAILVPNPQDQALAQQAAVKTAITQSLTKLEQIKAEVLEDPGLTAEEKEAAIQALDKAIETLKQPNVSQQEALAALDSAQQELQDLSSQSAAQQQKALEGLSGLFSDTAAKDLAEALANGDLAAAAEALKNLDPSTLTAEQQQQLGEALESAADALEGTNPELSEQLGNAGEALQNGDAASAQESLDAAGEQMQQQAQSGGSNPQIDQYSGQVGESGESVAQAGKGSGANQPGQGGMSQAPGGQGQGQGSGQEQGQGPGSGGAGRGEGNGEAQGGQSSGQMETDNGPGDGGETSWESIFDPQRVGGEGGEDVDIPGQPDAGVPTGAEGDFAQNPDGESSVPYNEVWTDYSNAVNQALESGYIPLGMRDLIKNYFSNLDPNKK